MYRIIIMITCVMITCILGAKHELGIILGWMMAFGVMNHDREMEERHYAGEGWIYYPTEKLVKIKKYKFLFQEKHLPKAGIPKEDYLCRIINFYGFCVATVIGILAVIISQKASLIVFLFYIIFNASIKFICSSLKYKKNFYRKFKRLNIYNCIYRIIGGYYPTTKKIGKCKIISECKKGKHTYVKIEMVDNKKVQEKVIFSGAKKQGKDPTYTLYEICKVFYIM